MCQNYKFCHHHKTSSIVAGRPLSFRLQTENGQIYHSNRSQPRSGYKHNTVCIWMTSNFLLNFKTFNTEWHSIVNCASTYACPLILLGDVNLHLDVTDNPHTIKWQSIIDSHGLIQHVTSSTHREGHILNVVVTRSDCPVTDVHVESLTISDHSFITTSVDLRLNNSRRRKWRNFDCDEFCNDLRQLQMLCSPPVDVTSLITCYDTLQSLLDKHAPFVDVK